MTYVLSLEEDTSRGGLNLSELYHSSDTPRELTNPLFVNFDNPSSFEQH